MTQLLVANGPGIGDAMVLSIVVEELARQRGEMSVVSSCYSELFLSNPHVVAMQPWKGPGARSFPELDDMRVCGGHSMYAWMLRKFGLDPVRAPMYRQTFYFGDHERDPVQKGRYVTVSPWAGAWTRNKDWQWDQWEILCEKIQSKELDLDVYQLGAAQDRRLSKASGKWMGADLRTVARLLRDAAAHVCVVTGTMHMASAFKDLKTAVIFGGREDGMVTGYPGHVKFSTRPPQGCSPCWLVPTCPHLRGDLKPCMEHIEADEVFAVLRHLVKHGPVVHSNSELGERWGMG